MLATVLSVINGASHMTVSVLGSANGAGSRDDGLVTPSFQNGWARLTYMGTGTGAPGLVSLATSVSTDITSGVSTPGASRVRGLPAVGFLVRSLFNGTLSCGSAASCLGSYASAFPHKLERAVVAP